VKRSDFLKSSLSLAGGWLLSGCKAAEQVAREVVKRQPGGDRALRDYDRYAKEFDRYAKIAHILKKYHDKGNLDDNDVLDVLHAWGATKTPAPKPRTKRRADAAKPFPVPDYKGGWRWPLDAGIVSSEFGKRWGGFHYGIDIAADMGTPIHAAAPGKVLYSDDKLRGYGNVVIIRHDERTTSIYGHNKVNKVRVGDEVKAGTLIALLGSTGHSTGPHLHFEVRRDSAAVPPRDLLPKSRF